MMLRAWRIVKEVYAATAFDGQGAWLYGGRWNSQGTRVVYASETQSLAILESLVHLNPSLTFKYMAIPIEFDNKLVESVAVTDLPVDWTEEPPPPSTKRIGDQWLKKARSVVLKLPSVIVQSESNYLINPAHSDFKKINIGKPRSFAIDPRLL
jgi:RES domain-containing protein